MNQPPSKARKMGEVQRLFRDAFADAATPERVRLIMEKLMEAASEGCPIATKEVLDRALGKASVGSTATLIDEAVSQSDQVKNLTIDELRTMYRLHQKARGETSEPVVIDAKVIEHMPPAAPTVPDEDAART